MLPRSIFSLLAVLLLCHPFAGAQSDPGLVPVKQLSTLERAARDLAKAGVTAEAVELIEILEALGLPAVRLTRLRDAAEKFEGKGGKSAREKKGPRAAKSIGKAVVGLAGLLEGAKEEDRGRLAEILVRLDNSCDAAQRALGREQLDGRWITPGEQKLAKRRAAIQEALRRARRFKLPLETDDSAHALIEKVTGCP